MTQITSWQHLKDLLCRMKADGEDGFEGLIAALFESETGERFFVARKGDQPAGDAYSPTARTAIQAKRIDQSVIRENDVEGDIDRALRETPALDVYVVAATKASNQLRLRLEEKTQETGLDVVLLALADTLSELGALCVAHWDVVQVFFPSVDKRSDDWAITELAKTETTSALARLRNELRGIQTQKLVTKIATLSLERRFQGAVLGSHGHNRVVRESAVDRSITDNVAATWRRQGENGVAVLEGDEGTGKTWVAAAVAHKISSEQDVPVIWLDSLAWLGIETIENLVISALETVLAPGDDKRRMRIFRKIFRRWPAPIFIILDGVNERRAWESAERLLHDYDLHRVFLTPRVRLLFTSRLLEHRPFGGSSFWRSAKVIKVGPFSSEEFPAAMLKFLPGISVEELPVSIRELARIPRYFRLCVQLRERLASVSHVSKELLLWADLESKLENRDPQWVDIQAELSGTPQQILSFLAKQAKWPTNSPAVALPRAELLRHLPGFDRVRHDLEEQHIVVSADLSEAHINASHVVLGWALVLRETAKKHLSEGIDALCDRLHRLMEPAASNDEKARAVHVAAIMTFLDAGTSATDRVALLRLWALHHNAVVTSESIGFFARTDLHSYVSMVESFFREHLAGHFESTLIAPLAIMWRDGRGASVDLKYILERWLRLVFPGDTSGSKEGEEAPMRHFPAAETMQQLRLSYAAIGIISFAPIFELLPALVECYRSDDFTYRDLGTIERPARLPAKSPMAALGVLARWRYGETAIPTLAGFASGLDQKSKEWKNLRWFARLWRCVSLPEQLGVGEDIYYSNPNEESSPLEEFRNWLLDRPAAKDHLVGIGVLERLAVDRDLPDLSEGEVEALIKKVKERVDATARYRRYHGTWEERGLDDLLPWLARFAPHEFNLQIRELWRNAVASDETLQRLLHLDEMLPPVDPGRDLIRAILARRDHFSAPDHADAAAIPLTEAVLFHANEAELYQWLKCLETRTLTRGGGPVIGLLPIPRILEELAPAGLEVVALREVENAIEGMKASPSDQSARDRVGHWLQVYAAVAKPSKEVAEWAIALAETFTPGDPVQFALFCIVSKCPSEEVLCRAIFHPSFRPYHFGVASSHWFPPAPGGQMSQFTFAELSTKVSFTVMGQILLRGGIDEELRSWGRAISALAMIELENRPPLGTIQIQIETRVSRDGELEGFSTQYLPNGGESWHSVSSGVWGVDRETRRPAPTEEDYDRLIQGLHDLMEARKTTVRREFAEFNAVGALWRWSEIDSAAFADFVAKFLPRALTNDFKTRVDFGFFADATFIALLRLNPSAAVRLLDGNKGFANARTTALNRSVDWIVAALWEKKLNSAPAVLDTRRNILLAAQNDEELLWQSLCAISAGNSQSVIEFANELMSSGEAKARALGVTLLGYLGDNASLEALVHLRESDSSFWVREHAAWAIEVCTGEIACRKRYRAALESKSLEMLAPALAELRMAMSPLAPAWRQQIEQEKSGQPIEKRSRAYLEQFWYHWGNTSSRQRDIKLGGRDLLKFCRGEPLKDGVTSRMAPWWQLD